FRKIWSNSTEISVTTGSISLAQVEFLTHLPIVCRAQFETGHGLVVVHSPGVGEPLC
uniref:Uncharacterized protein n=1 Tax=Pseudonaja textilis TaxID=8673 RepID=A0A670YVK4_PSETE